MVSIGISLATTLMAFFILLDSTGDTSTSTRILPDASVHFVVPFLLIWSGIRIGWNVLLEKRFCWFLQRLILPILGATTVGLTVVDALTPLNTVYAYTRIHQSHIGVLFVFLLVIILVNQSNIWWEKHWKSLFALFPIAAFAALLTVANWPWNVFLEVVKEDRVMENVQYMILALGSIATGLIAWRRGQKKEYLGMILAAAISFSLFAVAGDEISWMQRNLDLKTPAYLLENNRQEEISFHNLYAVEWMVEYAYLSIALTGSLAPFIREYLEKKKYRYWKNLFPHPITFFFFVLPALKIAQNISAGGGQFRGWSEPVELCLYIGLVVWCLQLSVIKIKELFPSKT